jgi:tellurite resistance protein TehA-like permease
MTSDALTIDRLYGKSVIIRDFAPGWYASVMGTAVLVLDFFVFREFIPFADFWQLFFLTLAVAMFVLITVPWILRWILHFDAVRTDLRPAFGALPFSG